MVVDQTAFRDAILDPTKDRPVGLLDGDGNVAGRRFDVYRNNVVVSLIEALETAFPVIRKLVGAENFKLLAGTFLRQYPPKTPLIMFYGAEMPEFLGGFEPTKGTRYLPDVARLELALRESYHSADATPIDPSELQALPPEDLTKARFELAPSLRLVRSDWPIFAIWRFNMVEDAPKPETNAEDVIVVRPDLDPTPVLLPPSGGAFVQALLDKAPFGDAMEMAAAASEAFDLTQTLTTLIETQTITKIGD